MADEITVKYNAEFDKLARQTRNIERRLKGVDEQAEKSQRQISQFNNQANKIATTAKRIGGALAGAFAVDQIAQAGRQLVRTTADFQKSMSNVRALTQANEQEFRKLNDQAKQLGRTTVFSAQEASEGMGFLAQAGFETNEIMNALPGTLELAAAGNLELARSADIASNVLSGYGLQAEEINRVNDILASTATSTNVNVQQLGESFRAVAPIAESANVSLEETSAALGALGDAGIQGSRAGTQLRGVIASLSDMTPKAKNAIKDLGLSMDEADIESEGLVTVLGRLNDAGLNTQQAMQIFGREASSAATVIAGASETTNKFSRELQNANGTAEELAEEKLDNLAGSFQMLGSATESFAITLGEKMAPEIRGVVEGITDWIQGITDYLALSPEEQIKREQEELNTLATRLQMAKEGTQERSDLIDQLNKKYPQFLENLSKEEITNEKISDRLKDANEQYTQKIVIASEQEKLLELQNKLEQAQQKENQQRKNAVSILKDMRGAIPDHQYATLLDLFESGSPDIFEQKLNQVTRRLHEQGVGADELGRSIAFIRSSLEGTKEEFSESQETIRKTTIELEDQKRNIQETKDTLMDMTGVQEESAEQSNKNADAKGKETEETDKNSDAKGKNSEETEKNKEKQEEWEQSFNIETLEGQKNTLELINDQIERANVNDQGRIRVLKELRDQYESRINQTKRVLGLKEAEFDQDQAQQQFEEQTQQSSLERLNQITNQKIQNNRKEQQAARETARSVLNSQLQQINQVAQANSEFAKFQKVLAIQNLLVNQGQAIAAGIKSASTLPFPANLAAIGSVIATITNSFLQARQLLTSSSVPSAPSFQGQIGGGEQEFAEGTKYVERGDNPKGVDTVPARLTEGEGVIPVDRNKKYSGLVSAIIDDDMKSISKWATEQPYISDKLAQREKERSKDVKKPSNRKLEKIIQNNKSVNLEPETVKAIAKAVGSQERRKGW